MEIWIEGLTFQYPSGVTALQGIDLRISSGETVAILGENGAGKTTLAKHLNGLLKPTEGFVKVGDWDTREHSAAEFARRVGYVFQNPGDMIFHHSVRDEVAFGPKNLGVSDEELDRRVSTAIEMTDLQLREADHPYDLQVSERKLLGIASILAMETTIMVLDEPTMNLDAPSIEIIAGILRSLRKRQTTLIAITHDLEFAIEHFDRFIVLSEGQVLMDGSHEVVFKDADILESAGLEPPELVRLSARIGLDAVPRSIPDFLMIYQTERGLA